ncbi:MAG: hypothetical protein JSR38_15975, partial [Proteobacteria bacterium]|nr:hypothetical protein [Pseudomonadota bacterium]
MLLLRRLLLLRWLLGRRCTRRRLRLRLGLRLRLRPEHRGHRLLRTLARLHALDRLRPFEALLALLARLHRLHRLHRLCGLQGLLHLRRRPHHRRRDPLALALTPDRLLGLASGRLLLRLTRLGLTGLRRRRAQHVGPIAAALEDRS